MEGEGYRPKLEALINRTIKKVGEDIDALKANTAIAQLMILVNALYDEGGATRAEYEVLLQLLNPFVPHMTEELWQQMGHTDTLAYHEWPKPLQARPLPRKFTSRAAWSTSPLRADRSPWRARHYNLIPPGKPPHKRGLCPYRDKFGTTCAGWPAAKRCGVCCCWQFCGGTATP